MRYALALVLLLCCAPSAAAQSDPLYVLDTTIVSTGNAATSFHATRYFQPIIRNGVVQADQAHPVLRWVAACVMGADSGSAITTVPMSSTSAVLLEVYPIRSGKVFGSPYRKYIEREEGVPVACGVLDFGENGVPLAANELTDVFITLIPKLYSGSTASGNRTFYISAGYSYPSRRSNIP